MNLLAIQYFQLSLSPCWSLPSRINFWRSKAVFLAHCIALLFNKPELVSTSSSDSLTFSKTLGTPTNIVGFASLRFCIYNYVYISLYQHDMYQSFGPTVYK